MPLTISAAQFQDVDIGEARPDQMPQEWFVALPRATSSATRSCSPSTASMATRPESASRSPCRPARRGTAFVQRCFTELENAVNAARSYRGKVLSLDGDAEYRGARKASWCIACRRSTREEVILPERR